jgi:Cyclic nucleotide-binding domain
MHTPPLCCWRVRLSRWRSGRLAAPHREGKSVVLAGGGLGEALALAIYGVGDVFGELALISDDHHRITTIQALEASETLVLRRGDFEELRRSHLIGGPLPGRLVGRKGDAANSSDG